MNEDIEIKKNKIKKELKELYIYFFFIFVFVVGSLLVVKKGGYTGFGIVLAVLVIISLWAFTKIDCWFGN